MALIQQALSKHCVDIPQKPENARGTLIRMVLISEDDFAKIEKWFSVILKHTLPDRVQVLYRLTLNISL